MKINTSTAFVDLLAESAFSVVARVSPTPSQLLRRIGVTIRRFGVCLFAMGFFFSPLSLEAGQKKSGKSKKSGTSVVKKNPSVKSKSPKKKKNSKSKSPSNAPASNPSPSSPSTPPASNPSPSSPSTPPASEPIVERLLQDILTNLETYKGELAISDDTYNELQKLVREFGVEDIVETVKSSEQTATFFNALKNQNILTTDTLISELKNILNSQYISTDDFIYLAWPAPVSFSNILGGVFQLGVDNYLNPSGFINQVVTRFQIAKYETTWGEWQAIRNWAKNNGYDIGYTGSGKGEIYPVTDVSWYDVLKWCNAKSESEGLTPVYTYGSNTYKTGELIPDVNSSANGYRIPTEIEWEWAARGGILSNGYIYSGSNSIDTIAWYSNNSGSGGASYTKPTGTKLPNELGIYDMSGNVSEWCFANFWSFYSERRAYARGGSWNSTDFGCKLIVKDHFLLSDRWSALGFRLARTPTPTPQLQATVATLAGMGVSGYADGQETSTQFNSPCSVTVDVIGNLYIADRYNHRIRKITPSGNVTTLAGSGTASYADGQGLAARFYNPAGVAVDSSGNVYVADSGNHRIRKITPSGNVTTLAGSGTASYADGQGLAARFNNPAGVAVDASGNVYVADSGNHRIRKITPSGEVSTLAGSGYNDYGGGGFGDGQGTAAMFNYPIGVALDAKGGLYVADSGNHRIRKITPSGNVTTLAGSGTASYADRQGLAARFYNPAGVAVDASGNTYVADTNNNRIRKITPSGNVTTLAGSGTASYADGHGTVANFNAPYGVAVDGSGNVYVADSWNHRIRKITISQ